MCSVHAMEGTRGATVSGRGMRWARAVLVSLLTVLVAVVAHVLAGGATGSWWPLLVVAAAVTPLSWWWSDRRWGTLELLVVLGLAQGLLHVLLATGGAAAGSMHAAHHTGASMALAHGLATLVTVVLVRQADAAVHAIADLLRTLLDVLLPTLGTPRVPTTYPRPAIGATVAPVLTGHRQRRHPDRGPPFAPQLLPSPTPVP